MGESVRMGREEFLAQVAALFPETEGFVSQYGHGLLHCEVGDFLRVVEAAMDEGRQWQAQKYLEFIDRCLSSAGEELENALMVSFVEGFALGEVSEHRRTVVRERMPARLRDLVTKINGEWRTVRRKARKRK